MADVVGSATASASAFPVDGDGRAHGRPAAPLDGDGRARVRPVTFPVERQDVRRADSHTDV